MPEAWVYLLRCRDGSLYTGWTIDLERRLARHRDGTASRYTASRLPIELAAAMPMPDRTSARREEARIKRLPRTAKLALLRSSLADEREYVLAVAGDEGGPNALDRRELGQRTGA
jgi:putative endonuclease